MAHYHIVDFEEYCPKCKHWLLPESISPCWECLEEPAAEDSKRPLYFEEDKSRRKNSPYNGELLILSQRKENKWDDLR